PPLVRFLNSASRWARTFADSSRTAKQQEQGPPLWLDSSADRTDCQSLLEYASASRVAALLKALGESRELAAARTGPSAQPSGDLLREVASSTRRRLHYDRGIALLSACAATGACLIACALWIELSWPEGGVAAQFAAIGCSLSATLDKPSKLISAA